MDHNRYKNQQNYSQNKMHTKPTNMMTNNPIYIYGDQQAYRRATTNPPYNNHHQYNQNMQRNNFNQMKHMAPKSSNHKVKSAKTRQKNRMPEQNDDLPPNNPSIPRNRSKTEGQNILHNKNAPPKRTFTPQPPNWQNGTIEQRIWNNNTPNHYGIYKETSDVSYPSIPGTTVTTPQLQRSGTIIVHKNQPTYGNKFGQTHKNEMEPVNNMTSNVNNGIQMFNSTTHTGPIPFAAVSHNNNNKERHWKQCPLRYMGCDAFDGSYNVNEHYTRYQMKHLDYVIIHFNSKLENIENNYKQKLNNLENENKELKNQLKELMQRMDGIENRINDKVVNGKLPVPLRKSVHSRIPPRNGPTESKVPATFKQFQKSRSPDPFDAKE